MMMMIIIIMRVAGVFLTLGEGMGGWFWNTLWTLIEDKGGKKKIDNADEVGVYLEFMGLFVMFVRWCIERGVW